MKQLSQNLFVETQTRGCNFGYVSTKDGVVLLDTPQQPSDALQLRRRIHDLAPVRYILNTEPHGDHWSGNCFFDAPAIAHEGVRRRILRTDVAQWIAYIGTLGPEEGELVAGQVPNAPALTFEREMTLHVGDHTFRLIHMPGHTLYQAAILIEPEGVVFTSDNVFHRVQTWLQEADPDLWLESLDHLRRLDAQILVPGHGELCDKRYLDEQAEFVSEWKANVHAVVGRGLSKEQAYDELTDRMLARYPMDIGLEPMGRRVMQLNVSNLYDYLTHAGRWQGAAR